MNKENNSKPTSESEVGVETHVMPGEASEPVPACGNCKFYQKDIEYNGMGNCKNTEVMGSRIILKYCEEFYLTEDFGCTRFESKPEA